MKKIEHFMEGRTVRFNVHLKKIDMKGFIDVTASNVAMF